MVYKDCLVHVILQLIYTSEPSEKNCPSGSLQLKKKKKEKKKQRQKNKQTKRISDKKKGIKNMQLQYPTII